MGVSLVNGGVRISEEIGGSCGTCYCYIEIDGLLEPISRVFRRFRKYVDSSRGGRRKRFEYIIPINELKKFGDTVNIYEFNFSNRGYGPYINLYKIDCININITKSGASLNGVNFKIDGSIKNWIEMYQNCVPNFIRAVKSIQSKFGFNLAFRKAVRLEDIYNNPNNAWKIALIYGENKAIIRALQSYIQSSHELVLLMLVAEALKGKTLSKYGTPTWYIEKGQDYPTAIVEVDGRKFTVWYQFSIKKWIDVVFIGLLKMFDTEEIIEDLQEWAIKGEFEIFERLFNVKPKDTKEAYELIKRAEKLGERQYVMPDIVIFEGEYEERIKIKENPPKRALIIDAKIEVGKLDVIQISKYKEIFNETLKGSQNGYIVACLGDIYPSYKIELERIGITVIENVAPDKEGEGEFIKVVRNFFNIT